MTITEQTAATPHADQFPVDEMARPRARRRFEDTPTERLQAELTSLSRQLQSGTYELLVLVGELDGRGTWATWGALSCAAWLAALGDIEVSTARTQVRVARALREYPLLDVAMACGDISYAKARVLVPHLTSENVEPLVAIAESTAAGRLGLALAAWSTRNEGPETIDARQHDDRAMSWRVEPDGMVTFTVKLPPLEAGLLQARIDTEVIRHDPCKDNTHNNRSSAPAGASDANSTEAIDHEKSKMPSLAQQRVDALLRILDTTHDPSNAGQKPGTAAEVVVHVRPDGNTLADGTPLSDHAVGKLLPEAFVSLLVKDNQRLPVDASPRRRFPTRRQRRVIDERSDECAHPGCHAHTFLQYDHIEPFTAGGPTTLDNLQRLCGPHNRAKEQQ